jgi:hypothetical protein
MKRTLFAVSLALTAAVGCGGGGGGGGSGGTTYSLASAVPLDVPASSCQVVAGPTSVQAGTMFYEVDDDAPGTDLIESVIISDSFYISYGCTFDASTQAITDDTFTGSHQSTGQIPLADSYDFIVVCHNATTDCQFDLTWTATY